MNGLYADDLELVQHALARQSAAVEALGLRMRCIGRILGAWRRRAGARLSAEAAEDLAQDVAMTVWRHLPSYEGRAPLEGWIASFCRNGLHNAARSERKADSVVPLETDPATPLAQDDGLEAPVQRCLDRLAQDDQDLMRAKHFDGLTLDEIARRVQRNLNSIKARYYRALLQLKQCLGHGTATA
jgi:RNA polymerase sigma factor (sigma-70 family)